MDKEAGRKDLRNKYQQYFFIKSIEMLLHFTNN